MIEKITMECSATFDKTHTMRYQMSKVWDSSKESAAVITIAPGAETATVVCDVTTQRIVNNLFRLNFGSFEAVNLFSKIGANIKGLKSSKGLFDNRTDEVIDEVCKRSDKVIIAWGKINTKSKAISERVESVISILTKYENKLYFISDEMGRCPLHPLCPSLAKKWTLVPAKFEPETPIGTGDGSIIIE